MAVKSERLRAAVFSEANIMQQKQLVPDGETIQNYLFVKTGCLYGVSTIEKYLLDWYILQYKGRPIKKTEAVLDEVVKLLTRVLQLLENYRR